MKISKGKIKKPHLVLIYGKDGVGKSTWASFAPNPVYIDLERSTLNLDVGRVDGVAKYTQVTDTIAELTKSPQGFETLVIDTIDWLDSALQKQICLRDGVKAINRAAGGYGAGPQELLTYWKGFQKKIDTLQEKTGMNVVFICHAHARDFNDPAVNSSYVRYELKLYEDKQNSVRALFREWVDSVLFITDETYVEGEGKTARGHHTGDKIIHTKGTPAWDAKSRFRLPEALPFPDPLTSPLTGFSLYAKAVAGKYEVPEPAATAKELDELVEETEGDELKVESVKERLRAIHDRTEDPTLKESLAKQVQAAGVDLTALTKIEKKFSSLVSAH